MHRETGRAIEAFELWYQNHRSYSKTLPHVATSQKSLQNWCEWFNWHARADARDREAAAIADREAVKRRAEMLKRHRQAGELLVRRGMEHHAKREILRTADATAAIKQGIEIERTAEGLPAWVASVLNAQSDDELALIERALLGNGAEAGADPDPEAPAGTLGEGEGPLALPDGSV